MAQHRHRAFGTTQRVREAAEGWRGLTQLTGGAVEAGGTDAGAGDRVALLGGSGTLAHPAAALTKGPRPAGCQERGH